MTFPPPDDIQRMTAMEVLDVLRTVLDQELLECVAMAEGFAERLAMSGKHDQAGVALQIAAKIRARRAT